MEPAMNTWIAGCRSEATDDLNVAAAMVTSPKTMPVTCTVSQAVEEFANPHVHMLLLTEDGVLMGAVQQEDIDPETPPSAAVVDTARLEERTVAPDRPVAEVLARMRHHGQRRLAVVDVDGRLLGLLCLKRDLTGFCTDDGVAARAAERTALAHADKVEAAVSVPGRRVEVGGGRWR